MTKTRTDVRVWLVETREESDHSTGERKGPWYPCGYQVHRTRSEAYAEAEDLMGPGPNRVVEYVRKRAKP